LESKQETIRAFLAAPVDSTVIARISRAVEFLKTGVFTSARWVRPENMHITIKFFAELPHRQVDDIRNIMEFCAGHIRKYTFHPTGLDAFPNKKYPNVIWLGLRSDTDDHHQLVKTIEHECSKLGFAQEKKKDIPHITMARIRNPRPGRWPSPDTVVKLFDNMPCFSINSLKLIQSTLSAQGAMYNQLHEVFFESYPLD
jgi:RNA 2',3'-cyclic 3'-phosphodiesterase